MVERKIIGLKKKNCNHLVEKKKEKTKKKMDNNMTTKVVAGTHVVLVRQYDGKQGQTVTVLPAAPITTKVIEKRLSLVSVVDKSPVTEPPPQPVVIEPPPSTTNKKDRKYIEYGIIGGAAALVGYFLYHNSGGGAGE